MITDHRGGGSFYPSSLGALEDDESTLAPVGESGEVEYFFASDARLILYIFLFSFVAVWIDKKLSVVFNRDSLTQIAKKVL